MQTLTKLAPNLAFKRETVEQAFQMLADARKFDALSDPDDKEDWVETMSRRLRSACRHVAQARVKKPPPKWLRRIDVDMAANPGAENASGSGEAAGAAEPAQPAAPEQRPEQRPEPAQPQASGSTTEDTK